VTADVEYPAVRDAARSTGTPPAEGRPHPPRRVLSAFLAIAGLALVVLSAGTIVVSERIARQGALDEAESSARRISEFLVLPLLTEALAGIPGRWEELRLRVDDRLTDETVTAVIIWSETGEVLFASNRSWEGQVFRPTSELQAAVDGEVVAHLEEHSELSPLAAVGENRVLGVYVPEVVDGERLVVEVHFPDAAIDRQAALLRSEILPLAVGSMLLLQLVQVPIAVSLVRRVRRQDVERAALIALNLTASERERRTIAGDVHDGPVQEIAGVNLVLSSLRRRVPTADQATVDRLVSTLRNAGDSLRRLVIDIYPPDLSASGLQVAVAERATLLEEQGVQVRLRTERLDEIDPSAAAVVYRTAREALTNVARHASASSVVVVLQPTVLRGRSAVHLEVTDDGVGLTAPSPSRHERGHLGLRLLRDRVEALGGRVSLGTAPGGGTSVVAVVPSSPSS
jgi:two-component system, NarL family, sensor kinase